jgi:hypothetical protein
MSVAEFAKLLRSESFERRPCEEWFVAFAKLTAERDRLKGIARAAETVYRNRHAGQSTSNGSGPRSAE